MVRFGRNGSPASNICKPCAQCGETLFAAAWSEYLSAHRVRHLWSCDACGYEFETTVTFARPLEREDMLETAG
jgi:hypothetical protein